MFSIYEYLFEFRVFGIFIYHLLIINNFLKGLKLITIYTKEYMPKLVHAHTLNKPFLLFRSQTILASSCQMF